MTSTSLVIMATCRFCTTPTLISAAAVPRGWDPFISANFESIATAIYGEFQAGNVTRAQDRLELKGPAQPLAYYREWETVNVTAPDLLQHFDGQCTAWAELFARCMHAVGVNPEDELVDVRPIYSPNLYGAGAWFLVNTWAAPGMQSNPDPSLSLEWPYLNVPHGGWFKFDQRVDDNLYDFCHEDVLDISGVSGQNTIDPASLFVFHRLVVVGDKLFDPSYGTPPYGVAGPGDDIAASFESQALWGYALQFGVTAQSQGLSLEELQVNCDLDLDGDIDANPEFVENAPALILRSNPPGNQLKVTQTDL
ncbi:MAG: hypothetical protein ACR2GY_13295 [Phycisphaerales bacterium]